MSRVFLAVAILGTLTHQGEAACSFSFPYRQRACLAWNALGDAFDRSNWNVCSTFVDGNPCASGACPRANNLVTCSGDGRVTAIQIQSDINMQYDGVSDLSTLEQAFVDMTADRLTEVSITNQASLDLDQCLDSMCNAVTCDFTNSGCTGSCTDDGICIPTPAPTPAPTASECTYSNQIKRRNCLVWNALADAFQSQNWNDCQNDRNVNPCVRTSCARRNRLVRCRKGMIKKIRIRKEFGLSYDGTSDLTALTTRINDIKTDKLKVFKIENNAGLNLNVCLPSLCDSIKCSFVNSQCTGTCTTTGLCA